VTFFYRFKRLIVASIVLLSLAACESVEERAEGHYQSGLELMEAGDYERAAVEFRNVFQLNGSHQAARHALAEILLDHNDDARGAYGQYLRLAEQYPEDLKARLQLSELAFSLNNWEEMDRHGAKAQEIDPENPRVQIITLARAYRDTGIDNDASARRAFGRDARALLEQTPDSSILRNIIVDDDLRNNDYAAALAGIDTLLETDPDNQVYWRQRLGVLGLSQDLEGIETQLRKTVELFPEDTSQKQMLIRFYLSQGDMDSAEEFLRELVAKAEPGDVGPQVDVIRFLEETQDAAAVEAELDSAIEAFPETLSLRAIRAGMNFRKGDRDRAVTELETLLDGADSTDETRSVKVTLARMLLAMNNEVGARALVEEVLTEDEGNADALKMRASWLIESDNSDEAVAALRVALDSAPEDAQAMTLMARAHTRSGRADLAREFLALAVEASGNAPAESIRYASLLLDEERYLPAEDILLPALRLDPQNVDLMRTLGRLYFQMDDMGRVQQVAQTLRRLETPQADQAANALDAQRIGRQNGLNEAVEYIEEIANASDASLTSKIALVRARLGTGNTEGGLTLARELLAEEPDNAGLKAMLASVEAVSGNLPVAEQIYRDLLSDNPQQPNLWLELSQLRARQSDPEGAVAVIETALEEMPDAPRLLWARASYFERDNRFEDALAIYEKLYEQNTNSLITANNLASMLATYRTDDESLERAWNIARRFRDTEQPAAQDTYGWIAFRRGDAAEALPYLQSAAAGLTNDPIVQYHLGRAYQALGQSQEAMVQFQKALDIAGPVDPRPQIADAQVQLDALRNPPAEN